MLDRSSQESEGLTSDSNKPDTQSPSNAKPMPSAEKSSEGIGPKSRSTKTFVKSHRAASKEDADKWIESELSPTLNQMDLAHTGNPNTLVHQQPSWEAWDSLNHAASKEVSTMGQNTGMATGRAGVIFRSVVIQDTREMEKKQNGLGVAESEVAYTLDQTGAQGVLISSAEGSPAKTSQLPESEPDSQANDQDSSSRQPESLTLFSGTEAGFSLRMFPDSFPHKAEEISESFSRRWPNSGFMTSPGECWTVDTSECRSDGGVSSSLPDVLEADVPPRFYLSQKAAAGILRRAERRGKALPEHLESALRELSGQAATRDEADPTTSTGKGRSSLPPSPPSGEREAEGQQEMSARTLSQDRSPADTGKASTQPLTMEQSSVRRLTPTECERLQGFPDGWTVP